MTYPIIRSFLLLFLSRSKALTDWSLPSKSQRRLSLLSRRHSLYYDAVDGTFQALPSPQHCVSEDHFFCSFFIVMYSFSFHPALVTKGWRRKVYYCSISSFVWGSFLAQWNTLKIIVIPRFKGITIKQDECLCIFLRPKYGPLGSQELCQKIQNLEKNILGYIMFENGPKNTEICQGSECAPEAHFPSRFLRAFKACEKNMLEFMAILYHAKSLPSRTTFLGEIWWKITVLLLYSTTAGYSLMSPSTCISFLHVPKISMRR